MDQVPSQILSLPSDVNPYKWVFHFLYRTMVPELPNWAETVLWLNIAFLSLCSIICILSLYLRWKQNTLWFFQLRDSPAGRLILPNGLALFSLFSGIYSIISIANVLVILQATDSDSHNPANLFAFYLIAGPWIQFAIVSEAYVQFVAVYLSDSSWQRIGKVPLKPWAVNIFFIFLFPLILFISMPFAIAAEKINLAWRIYHRLKAAAQPISDAWVPGDTFQVQPEALPQLNRYQELLIESFSATKQAGYTYFVQHMVVVIVYTPAALLYFYVLYKQLRSKSSSNAVHGQIRSFSSDHRLRNLQSSMISMIGEATTILISAFAYAAVCLWVAADPEHVLISPTLRAVVYLMTFSVFSLFGLPANCIILFRLFKRQNDSRRDSAQSLVDDAKNPFMPLSLVQNIKIVTEIAVHVDGEDVENLQLGKLGKVHQTYPINKLQRPFDEQSFHEKDDEGLF